MLGGVEFEGDGLLGHSDADVCAHAIGDAILVAAGLSFFGLGASPPASDWGYMVNTGKGTISSTPHVVLMPSIVIVLVALAFTFIGDGLRNVLDPQGSAPS